MGNMPNPVCFNVSLARFKGADVNQYLIQNPLTYYGTSSYYHQPHEATYKCKPAFVDDRRTSEHFDKSVLLDG